MSIARIMLVLALLFTAAAGPADMGTHHHDGDERQDTPPGAVETASEMTPRVAGLAELRTYPGYTGDLHITGDLAVSSGDGGLRVVGWMAGLEPSTSGGWHIHAGTSCDEAGEHLLVEGVDVWCSSGNGCSSKWASDLEGMGHVDALLLAFPLPAVGHTLVVHSANGTRVACGAIFPFGTVDNMEEHHAWLLASGSAARAEGVTFVLGLALGCALAALVLRRNGLVSLCLPAAAATTSRATAPPRPGGSDDPAHASVEVVATRA